jgi:death-on-curing protein
METFLVLNGFEIDASVDEQEEIIIKVASGNMSRNELADWLRGHVVEKTT